MVDGHVVGAYPSSEEKEEILNLKRGILSAFQVNPKGKDNTHTVDEVGLVPELIVMFCCEWTLLLG